MAAILQAAGGFLPGIGYFISPFATLPILIGAMFSLQMGVMSYFLTILLLFILFPSELSHFSVYNRIVRDWYRCSFFLFQEEIKHYFYWCHSLNDRYYESTICFSLSGTWSSRIRFLFIP